MLSLSLCIALFLSAVTAQGNASDYVVDLGYAQYRGILNDSYPKYTPSALSLSRLVAFNADHTLASSTTMESIMLRRLWETFGGRHPWISKAMAVTMRRP